VKSEIAPKLQAYLVPTGVPEKTYLVLAPLGLPYNQDGGNDGESAGCQRVRVR
jgi:hypothetical protein